MNEEPKRCRCGHDRDHKRIEAERSYGPMGWVQLLIGVTPDPTHVKFRCGKCGQVVEETSDPGLCAKYAQ